MIGLWLRDLITYRLGIQIPKYCNFILTKRCNSRCKFCNLWKSNEEGLPLRIIKRIFSDPFLKELEWFQLTGGEPFLYKDLVPLVKFLSNKFNNPEIWIPTNGILTRHICESVSKMPENVGISVSIDGRERVHDEIKGVKCYKNALATLKCLSKFRTKVSIGFTISKINYKEITHVYELARKLRVGFSYRPVNISEVYYENLDKESSFPKEGILFLSNFFRKIGRNDFYTIGTLEFLRNPRKRIIPCTALRNSFCLDHRGNVYPCLYFNVKLGNLLKQSMEEIWFSEKAESVRKLIKEGQCPNCWVECETYRNIGFYPEITKVLHSLRIHLHTR